MADFLSKNVQPDAKSSSDASLEGLEVIELIGTPGAGKSTLEGPLQDILRDRGLVPYRMIEAARIFARRTSLGALASRVIQGTQRSRALWVVYLIYSWAHALAFAIEHPRLIRFLVASQRRRPEGAEVSERRVLHWYFRLIGSYRFFKAKGHPGEVLIVDEGFVHRVVQLHASEVEQPSADSITTYLSLIPKPDLVVEVSAPRDLCLERIQTRGVWRRYREEDDDRLARFVASADRAVELAVEEVRELGWPLAVVVNSGELGDVRRQLELIIVARTGHSRSSSPENPPLYTLYLPRPGRIREAVEAALRPRAVAKELAGEVLSVFGVELVGDVSNLPMGWRNRNVLVQTSNGRFVLRQYPERWSHEAIVFEHSILDRLDEIGFPAPRLVPAPTGETLVTSAGSNWALYEYIDGTNMGACYLRSSERARLIFVAGATLAEFHEALGGFEPEGRHHLGFEGQDQGSIELSWYVGTLEQLASLPDDSEEAVIPGWRVPELVQRLSMLAETIDRSPVEKTVIHGDYGLHNLLFERNGQVTVLDFELARVDWRLVDLVRVLSRQKRYAGRAFISGYRETSDMNPDEFRLLPEVWELYRLFGAIRSWQMGHELGDSRRIATAKRRFEEADWISVNRLGPWEVETI